uniref:Uncharacterized protein n=1 Tax=Alteromonadaceae bacterium PE-TB08W TaxID=1199097 RepID=A0A3G9E4R5_9ALTE|nr:hypothetical protein [Alteromonadaceae bacterium PE-TB08W]
MKEEQATVASNVLQVGRLKAQDNFTPLPYRGVSYQPYAGEMSESAIIAYLSCREVYRRTNVVVLHNTDGDHAVVAIQRVPGESLFVKVAKIEVLALPNSCVVALSEHKDPANRSSLAQLAVELKISPDQTLVVQGRFDHINIIHRPKPLRLKVVEVAPPNPPKLFALCEHVLSYASLPPICLDLERIDLNELCKSNQSDALLVPCRSGGLDQLGESIHFLDERPEQRKDWTLIGCERSLQFHRHYYGDEPPRIEMCPRALTGTVSKPTLLKCCMLEFDTELEGDLAVVPWGADLPMVERALREVSKGVDYA